MPQKARGSAARRWRSPHRLAAWPFSWAWILLSLPFAACGGTGSSARPEARSLHPDTVASGQGHCSHLLLPDGLLVLRALPADPASGCPGCDAEAAYRAWLPPAVLSGSTPAAPDLADRSLVPEGGIAGSAGGAYALFQAPSGHREGGQEVVPCDSLKTVPGWPAPCFSSCCWQGRARGR